MIVTIWGDTPTSAVNLKVMLDGIGDIWKTSVLLGEDKGSWHWPVIKATLKDVDKIITDSIK